MTEEALGEQLQEKLQLDRQPATSSEMGVDANTSSSDQAAVSDNPVQSGVVPSSENLNQAMKNPTRPVFGKPNRDGRSSEARHNAQNPYQQQQQSYTAYQSQQHQNHQMNRPGPSFHHSNEFSHHRDHQNWSQQQNFQAYNQTQPGHPQQPPYFAQHYPQNQSGNYGYPAYNQISPGAGPYQNLSPAPSGDANSAWPAASPQSTSPNQYYPISSSGYTEDGNPLQTPSSSSHPHTPENLVAMSPFANYRSNSFDGQTPVAQTGYAVGYPPQLQAMYANQQHLEAHYLPYPGPYAQQPYYPNHAANPVRLRPPVAPVQIYSPPAELARGHLAQSRFHDAIYDRQTHYNKQSRAGQAQGGNVSNTGRNTGLPKPPEHSPHALWVGNVPSDATHAELSQFFQSRPLPINTPQYKQLQPDDTAEIDLNTNGIESIHLIARSNCAFVNYQTNFHLQHAIKVSNGISLRPLDSRCKELVCRVRKKDEDRQSGVGAQRVGGMHHAFIKAQEKEKRLLSENLEAVTENQSGHGHQDSLGGSSVHTNSTSSSYLAKHFEKRYFILKSHDEQDLKLSVSRGLWTTQSHNQPVLQQALKTSKQVFLIFSANRSGEFFGYARMISEITERDSNSSTQSTNRPPTIVEDETEETSPSSKRSVPVLFSPSEQRMIDRSPLPLDAQKRSEPGSANSAPPTLAAVTTTAFSQASTDFSPDNLHLPAEGRGESLDPKLLVKQAASSADEIQRKLREQQNLGSSQNPASLGEDGVWRKDTLPTAEERNAKLEQMQDLTAEQTPDEKSKNSSGEWGKPFKVEWIKVARLPFSQCRSIRNMFNSNREVKISRDGTEVEPSAGEALLKLWEDVRISKPEENSSAA